MKTHIVFEGLQNTELPDQIAALPEGEQIRSCLQCGACGGTCPVAPALEHTPRRIFALIRAGMKEEVLTSLTPWICSSCYECTVNCPAEIKITEIMYALKRMAIREGKVPSGSDAFRFPLIFTDLVCKYGRLQESELLVRYIALRHPIEAMRQAPLGLRMFAKGRMPVQRHRIKDREGFDRMVKKAKEFEEGDTP